MNRLIGDLGVEDPAVMGAMIAEFGTPVYRLALSIIRDPDDAQDAAQDTFIQAAAALKQYQVGTNFKAWLLTITINTCRKTLRKRASRRALQQAWQSILHLNSQQPNVEAEVVQGETRTELWRIVDELDEKHRLVVVLRLALDVPIHEISQILGVNEKTIYNRLYDAFAKLRVQIRTRPELVDLWDEVQP